MEKKKIVKATDDTCSMWIQLCYLICKNWIYTEAYKTWNQWDGRVFMSYGLYFTLTGEPGMMTIRLSAHELTCAARWKSPSSNLKLDPVLTKNQTPPGTLVRSLILHHLCVKKIHKWNIYQRQSLTSNLIIIYIFLMLNRDAWPMCMSSWQIVQ